MASAVAPEGSDTRTVHELRPELELPGVPESVPSDATTSQAGPDTLEKVRGSLSGSVASSASEEP